ncbi:MAG TPA: hypothetical protein VGK74_03375 [Symbiobacteriaceae bacterium]
MRRYRDRLTDPEIDALDPYGQKIPNGRHLQDFHPRHVEKRDYATHGSGHA